MIFTTNQQYGLYQLIILRTPQETAFLYMKVAFIYIYICIIWTLGLFSFGCCYCTVNLVFDLRPILFVCVCLNQSTQVAISGPLAWLSKPKPPSSLQLPQLYYRFPWLDQLCYVYQTDSVCYPVSDNFLVTIFQGFTMSVYLIKRKKQPLIHICTTRIKHETVWEI